MVHVAACMVTQPSRIALAAEAIQDLAAQEGDFKRTLVAVTDGGDHHADALRAAAQTEGVSAIVVAVEPGPKLGGLRNIALDACPNDATHYAQWDDDDRYHPNRLMIQMRAAELDHGSVGCCLTDQLYFFETSRTLYWVDWSRRLPRYASIRIPGTIVADMAVARQLRYPDASRAEDDAFLRDLHARGPVSESSGTGWCYLRRIHGANTWDRSRLDGNARWLGREASALLRDRATIWRALHTIGAPTGHITVRGRDRVAYELELPRKEL